MNKRVSLANPYATLEGWEADMFCQLLATIGPRSARELVACTGASNFTFDDEDERGAVAFDIPRGMCAVRGTKRIVIRNTWDDMIAVDFLNRAGKKIGNITPRYAEDMIEAFRDKTAIQTFFPRMMW